MSRVRSPALLALICVTLGACATHVPDSARTRGSHALEDALMAPVALPPGFGRALTDMGLVFTDSEGMTLYLYGGSEGACLATNRTPPPDMHPLLQIYASYPAPVCTSQWPSVMAAADAVPVAEWTIVQRPEGGSQWAYRGRPVHRSFRDRLPGDAHGTSGRGLGHRIDFQLALAPMRLPPGVVAGHVGEVGLIAIVEGTPLYTLEGDGEPVEPLSDDARWNLLPAAAMATNVGPWSVVSAPDRSQVWSFNGKRVYRFSRDHEKADLAGLTADARARLVVLKPVSQAPPGITVVSTLIGPAYADSRGMTLYSFSCMHRVPGEDSPIHNYFCDDYSSDVLHREQFCAAADRCAEVYEPLQAPADAEPRGGTWSVALVPDARYPMRWKPITPGEALPSGATKVWTYRGRPIYTSHSDTLPGQMFGYRDVLIGAFVTVVLVGESEFSG